MFQKIAKQVVVMFRDDFYSVINETVVLQSFNELKSTAIGGTGAVVVSYYFLTELGSA